MKINRRRFLSTLSAGALTAAYPGLSLARGDTDNRFVLVVLRGGLDGIGAVPPIGDPDYAPARKSLALALATPSGADGALPLDADFGLHPALAELHELYLRKELAIVHAVATPYRERSHFDGQDVLENGMSTAGGARDGWLNRALASMPGDASVIGDERGIAIGQTVPLVLRGATRVSSWAPSTLPDVSEDTLERIAWMYDRDEFFASRLQQALAARDLVDDDKGGSRRGRQSMQRIFAAAGKFLAASDGPRVAVLDTSGWDTHANQGAANGQLANRLRNLDAAVAALKTALGDAWASTIVAVATEFGRTVAINGTRGTDHGTASCAFFCGGAVAGGRVIADWPGLASGALQDGRDLRPTTDLQTVFKGIMRDHLGVAERELDRDVFPDGASGRPVVITA
ncbi:MAG: DUF1501 domain-containing protein [Gammaproteobacteria bacterium]